MLSKACTHPFQIESLESRTLLNASLIKDFNQTPASDTMYLLTNLGEVVLFVQNDGVHGTEVWRSDGTDAGTFMLADAVPGPDGSPGWIGQVGQIFLFSVTTPQDAHSVWRTDGTKQGTYKLKDVQTDSASDELNGSIYFIGYDDTHGGELWKSDGTVSGTKIVREIGAGKEGGAGYSQVLLYKNAIYFAGNDGVHGWELWRTDGTSSGTEMVEDLTPGAGESFVLDLYLKGGKLYFAVSDPAQGYNSTHYMTDGTTIEPAREEEINDIIATRKLGDRTYTIRKGGSLWRSDGTKAGTKRLAKSGFDGFMAVDRVSSKTNRLYAYGEEDGVYSSWMIRGDKVTPTPIRRGVQISNILYSTPDENIDLIDGLWRTDGSTEGTVKLCGPNYDGVTSLGDQVIFFTAYDLYRGDVGRDYYDPYAYDVTLYATDGTIAGTRELKHFEGSTNVGLFFDWYNSFSWGGVCAGNKLYFFLTDDKHGTELYYTDGTESGTRLVRDVYLGTQDSVITKPMAGVGGTYFSANGIWLKEEDGDLVELIHEDGVIAGELNGKQAIVTNTGLWMSDGTKEGTAKIFRLPSKNLYNSFLLEAGVIDNFIYFGKYLYPEGEDGEYRYFRSDGTIAGTHKVARSLEGKLYHGRLISYDERELSAIISTDSEGEHLHVLKDDFRDWDQRPTLFEAAGKMYFGVSRSKGYQIWRTDGTDRGTKRPGLLAGETGSRPAVATIGHVIYLKFTGALWTFDLDTGKSERLATFLPNEDSRDFIQVAGNQIFFSANDKHGTELWVSDGTAAGTKLVKDINQDGDSLLFVIHTDNEDGRDDYYAPHAAVYGDTLYFAADDGVHGKELWKSDGTAAGTVMVKDLYPGTEELFSYPGSPRSSWPQQLQVVGSTLLFSAADALHGRELWQLPLE